MLKKICIYQPNVFPPLHYFNRIMNSDVWVVLDDVQLNRKVGQTRIPLKINGHEHNFIIPVLGGNRVKINAASIAYHEDWITKFKSALSHAYGKSPYFDTLWSSAVEYIDYHRQMDSSFTLFCEQFTTRMLRKLGWQGEVVSSTDLVMNMKASERIAEIVYQLKGTHYVGGGKGFEQYVDMEHFRNRNVSIIVQNWKCPEYPQSKGEFVSNLSILDLIANMSLDEGRQLLLSGGLNGWEVYK